MLKLLPCHKLIGRSEYPEGRLLMWWSWTASGFDFDQLTCQNLGGGRGRSLLSYPCGSYGPELSVHFLCIKNDFKSQRIERKPLVPWQNQFINSGWKAENWSGFRYENKNHIVKIIKSWSWIYSLNVNNCRFM